MKTLKFKTNIMCDGCISTVTPFLNNLEDIKQWDVDIKNKDKILTIQTEKISSATIIEVLKKAGKNAEPI